MYSNNKDNFHFYFQNSKNRYVFTWLIPYALCYALSRSMCSLTQTIYTAYILCYSIGVPLASSVSKVYTR